MLGPADPADADGEAAHRPLHRALLAVPAVLAVLAAPGGAAGRSGLGGGRRGTVRAGRGGPRRPPTGLPPVLRAVVLLPGRVVLGGALVFGRLVAAGHRARQPDRARGRPGRLGGVAFHAGRGEVGLLQQGAGVRPVVRRDAAELGRAVAREPAAQRDQPRGPVRARRRLRDGRVQQPARRRQPRLRTGQVEVHRERRGRGRGVPVGGVDDVDARGQQPPRQPGAQREHASARLRERRVGGDLAPPLDLAGRHPHRLHAGLAALGAVRVVDDQQPPLQQHPRAHGVAADVVAPPHAELLAVLVERAQRRPVGDERDAVQHRHLGRLGGAEPPLPGDLARARLDRQQPAVPLLAAAVEGQRGEVLPSRGRAGAALEQPAALRQRQPPHPVPGHRRDPDQRPAVVVGGEQDAGPGGPAQRRPRHRGGTHSLAPPQQPARQRVERDDQPRAAVAVALEVAEQPRPRGRPAEQRPAGAAVAPALRAGPGVADLQPAPGRRHHLPQADRVGDPVVARDGPVVDVGRPLPAHRERAGRRPHLPLRGDGLGGDGVAHLPPLGPEDEPVDEDGDERDGHDAGDQPEGHADPAHRLGPAARPLPASAHDRAAPFRLPCFQDDTHLAVRGACARQNGPTIERSSSTERR